MSCLFVPAHGIHACRVITTDSACQKHLSIKDHIFQLSCNESIMGLLLRSLWNNQCVSSWV